MALFTLHYPYETGETFLMEELKFASKEFDNIIIFTLAKNHEEKRWIPENSEVVLLRKNKIGILSCFIIIINSLINVFPQLYSAVKFGHKISFSIIKRIITSIAVCRLVTSDKKVKNISFEDTILYSYWFTDLAYALCILKHKEKNFFCVTRAHGSDVYIDKFYQPFRKFEMTNLDEIYVISDAGKKSIEEKLMFGNDYRSKIKVARLGVVPPKKYYTQKRLLNDTKIIVSCSNLIDLKRVDCIISALAEINNENIQWIHFGDGDLEQQLKEKAGNELGNKKNISYEFKGYVPNEDIINYYIENSVTMFVNCSISEGIPVSVMEAFSCGIPAVATDVGGTKELVSNENGILIDKNFSVSELSEIINKFPLYGTQEWKILSDGALHTFDTEFNSEKNYPLFFEVMKNGFNNKKEKRYNRT